MKPRVLKCVVWDLDHTVWHGVLAEGDALALRDGVAELVRTLDARGVLQSIASRNDAVALDTLERFGLRDYFLIPEFGATAKSISVQRIAGRLGIAVDALAFIDDEPYERAEVTAAHPGVLCIDPADAAQLLTRADVVIPDGTGANRRQLQLAELARQAAQDSAGGSVDGGPSEAFLRSLEMRAIVRRPAAGDLTRIRELMLRTNQLNTTGRVLPDDELARACTADGSLAVIVDVTDRFGDLGSVGFALATTAAEAWRMRMLMVSCRVRDRGVGAAVLGCLQRGARRAGARFRADFVRTPANRPMFAALKLAGFNRVDGSSETEQLLESDPRLLAPIPAWIAVDDQTGCLLP